MTKTSSLDINCDMGEYTTEGNNYDEQIMPYITSCNISCGYHSGDPLLIESTVTNALQQKIDIGAHPSYNDKKNFGRKSVTISIKQLKSEIKYQISALKGITESHGGTLNHIKAHGALYNDIHNNEVLAEAIIETIQSISEDLIMYVMAGSRLVETCEQKGIPYRQEVFGDRRYENISMLQSRNIEGSVISNINEIINKTKHYTNNKLIDVHGREYDIYPDTICIHSDTPNSIVMAAALHKHLIEK